MSVTIPSDHIPQPYEVAQAPIIEDNWERIRAGIEANRAYKSKRGESLDALLILGCVAGMAVGGPAAYAGAGVGALYLAARAYLG